MDFIKETKRAPKLTGIENNIVKDVSPPKPKFVNLEKPTKWNLNGILLIFFILFGIFFLYNCKYGMFKTIDIEPYAFNL